MTAADFGPVIACPVCRHGSRLHGDVGCVRGDCECSLAAVEERYDTGVREREEALREVGRLRARLEELETPEDPVIYLLWSGRHDAWWAPDERGYVASIERAGRYNRADAVRCVVQSAQCGIREQVTSMVAAPDNWTVSDRG